MIDVILPIRVRLESLTYGFEIVSEAIPQSEIFGRRLGTILAEDTKLR